MRYTIRFYFILFILTVSVYFRPVFAQKKESVEIAKITAAEFLEIYSDTSLDRLTSSLYLEAANHTEEELMAIALAWNSSGAFPCYRYAYTESWTRFRHYVDDFWEHDILYFDKGALCLRREGEVAIQPYYTVNCEIQNEEVAKITKEEFCAIYTDSLLIELGLIFYGKREYTEKELIQLAAAWNSVGEHSPCIVTEEDYWSTFVYYIENLMKHDLFFMNDENKVCIKRKTRPPLLPYYTIID